MPSRSPPHSPALTSTCLLLCSSTCCNLAPTTRPTTNFLHSGAATNPHLPPVPGSKSVSHIPLLPPSC
ncbi:hypothetical protein M405DRAFT_834010, partial [Rhizopogon salebrosus TDB-379]